jgi:Tol biopolymer transport system component
MKGIKNIIKGIPFITLGWVVEISFVCCTISGIWLLSPSVARVASPSWSPDGQNLTFECYYEDPTSKDLDQYSKSAGADICTIGSNGRNLVRLIKDPGADRYPVWSPEGSQIAYVREDGIYLIRTDTTNRRWLVKGTDLYPVWSPDGKYILFSNSSDIYLVAVADGNVTNLTAELDISGHSPSWILHGQKIVFLSTNFRGFHQQLRIMNADGSDKQMIQEKFYFCGPISVSDKGQVAFIDKSPPTFSCGDRYTTELDEWRPVQYPEPYADRIFTWSPTGQYLTRGSTGGLKVEDTKTGKTQAVIPSGFKSINEIPSWSSDDQRIAITLTDVVAESWTYNFHYGFIETWPEEAHLYIFDIQRNTMRLLI